MEKSSRPRTAGAAFAYPKNEWRKKIMAKKRMAWETAHYLGVVAAPETEDI